MTLCMPRSIPGIQFAQRLRTRNSTNNKNQTNSGNASSSWSERAGIQGPQPWAITPRTNWCSSSPMVTTQVSTICLGYLPINGMMDLLLTHGYFLYEDPKELQIMKPYPPLGILYICSHLRKKGIDAEVFDSTFSSSKELFARLQAGPPSIVGVYANLMTRSNAVEILRVAKAAGWQTVVGGPEPGAYIDEYLDSGADVVVIGEGELTLEELVPLLHLHPSPDALQGVSGIAFRMDDGSVARTPPRAQIRDIDTQPWPARETIDYSKYLTAWRERHGQGSVSLITARGCPYDCRWCSHEVFGKTHRRRKPTSVADELEWLINRYTPEMAWMADDVFTIHS